MLRQSRLPIALALLAAWVLSARVSPSFEPVRLKIVKTGQPLDDGVSSIRIPAETNRFGNGLRGPVVIVATLRNDTDRAQTIAWGIDGRTLGAIDLKPRARRRFDLVTPADVTIAPGSVIALDNGGADAANAANASEASAARHVGAASGGLTLEYLEVANLHGSSSAFVKFYIVPAARTLTDRPAWWLVGLVTLAIFALARFARAPAGGLGTVANVPRFVSRALTILSAIVASFLLVAAASSLFSPFAILIEPASFAVCALLIVSPGLWHLLGRARATIGRALGREGDRQRGLRRVDALLAALLVASFYTSAMVTLRADHQGNYSGLLQISRAFAEQVPFLAGRDDVKRQLLLQDGGGYDGQFVYYIAFDPFLSAFADDPARYWKVADAPPYRFGRIGFSLLTKIVSGDRPERYPLAMVWLVLAAHLGGVLALAGIFMHYGRSPWWALLYATVPGFVQSVHVTLPESIAAAGLLGGYWCWLRDRRLPSAALFALSLLVRETGAVLLVSLIAWEAMKRLRTAAPAGDLARGLAVPAFALATLVAWRSYVCWRLFPEWGWKGLLANPENLGTPFAGLLELARMVSQGAYFPDAPQLATAATFYPLLLIAGGVLAVALLWTRPNGLALATVFYAGVALSLNYPSIWVHVGNGERGTYELPLMLLVSLAALPADAPRLRGALLLFFVGLGGYLRFASVDARLVAQILPF